MFNKTIFNSLMTVLAGLFVAPAPKKPAKRYPTMVVSPPRVIEEWNRQVEYRRQVKKMSKGASPK